MNYTVIITASYIKSHPSIAFIKKVIESLSYINLNKNTPIILAHDFNNNPDYQLYLKNLEKYIRDKPNFKIIISKKWGHLTGNLRNAFRYVKTKYVLIMQHDLPFIYSFDIEKIINDIEQNNQMKFIRFNKRSNIPYEKKRFKKRKQNIHHFCGEQIKLTHYTYTRDIIWSDQNHICKTSYYKKIILKECENGNFMEKQLNNKINRERHLKKYGIYLFGKYGLKPTIKHIDARNNNLI
jgi:hypothetical protein